MSIEPIRRLPFVDVHQKDITPAIYQLLFSQELSANDVCYKRTVFEWDDHNEYMEREFKERNDRGWQNCYHNSQAMKSFIENPCTYKQALQEFKQWLLDRGVTKDEDVIIKIWW